MASEVETGLGSVFFLESATPDTFVELAELVNIPVPNGTTGLIDVSHMKTVGFKDYINEPLADGEEADLSMNWLPGESTEAVCLAAKGKKRKFVIGIPVNGALARQFTGTLLVRDYMRNNPMQDKRDATLRVKWIGEIAEAAYTAPTVVTP
jgi:hypothetical protein